MGIYLEAVGRVDLSAKQIGYSDAVQWQTTSLGATPLPKAAPIPRMPGIGAGNGPGVSNPSGTFPSAFDSHEKAG
jgi:hypothetical protein